MKDPYLNEPEDNWKNITEKLINAFPLSRTDLVEIVLSSWKDIFTITNADNSFHIGVNAFPKPQVMGFLLEALIGLNIEKEFGKDNWVFDPTGYDKDIVNKNNPDYSFEIKSSSSKNNIYGNRSYAKKGKTSKKSKDGFYLAINFEKFTAEQPNPQMSKIRFGYLSFSDWRAQKSPTGQNAHIPANIEKAKLLTIYDKRSIN